MKKFLIAKKDSMTQLFTPEGNVVPVTILKVQPSVITQVKTKEHEGYDAVQIGYGVRKEKNINKAQKGHNKTLGHFSGYQEFRVADVSGYKVGDAVVASQFVEGEKVKVTGQTRGRGFQGVVKRHHFHGSPASHGHKDQERHSGSIGAGGVQRVFKGVRMGGHMGAKPLTVANLKVVKVDADTNTVYLRGAVPGTRNTVLAIYA